VQVFYANVCISGEGIHYFKQKKIEKIEKTFILMASRSIFPTVKVVKHTEK